MIDEEKNIYTCWPARSSLFFSKNFTIDAPNTLPVLTYFKLIWPGWSITTIYLIRDGFE